MTEAALEHDHDSQKWEKHLTPSRGGAACDKPGIKGTDRATQVNAVGITNACNQVLASGHRVPHTIAMAADVLGQAVHDQVGAQAQGVCSTSPVVNLMHSCLMQNLNGLGAAMLNP